MSASSKSLPTIGFLTVCEHAEMGLFGGLLVLNAVARPLEFHCTAPVKPNRAQEILYGPTLKPFLYGEQIGQTLLSKPRLQPMVVFTDEEPMLTARDFAPCPLVLVLAEGSSAANAFSLGKYTVAVSGKYADDRNRVEECWRPYADEFDLREPFGRIRDAIEEAQKSARVAA